MFQLDKFPSDFHHYILLKKILNHHNFDLYLAMVKGSTNRIVMVKVPKQIFQDHEDFSKIFKSEIRINSLLKHQNIASINDFHEEGKYIEMEFLFGKSFRDVFNKYRDLNKEIPKNILVYLFKKTARGLDYVHQGFDLKSGKPLSLVHEEVNPHNVIFTYEGEVKVLDFGLSKSLTMIEQTTLGYRKESLFYKAPEYFKSDLKPDLRSDVYSLGIMMWEMLTGKKLFSGSTLPEVMEKITNPKVTEPSKLIKDLDPRWDGIVMKALEREPQKRFQSMKELYQALSIFETKQSDDLAACDEASLWLKNSFYSEFENERLEIQRLVGQAEKKFKLKVTVDTSPSRIERKMSNDLIRFAFGMAVVIFFVFVTAVTYNLAAPINEKEPYSYRAIIVTRKPAGIIKCNFTIDQEPDQSELEHIGNLELSARDAKLAIKDMNIFKEAVFSQVCSASGDTVIPLLDADGSILGGKVYRNIEKK